MADLTNIQYGSTFGQADEIHLGSNEIAQVYYGSNLIWEKTAPTESWYSISGVLPLVRYVPASNVTVTAVSVILSSNVPYYNFAMVIAESDGTNVYNELSTSNLSVTSEGTLGAYTKYRHEVTLGTSQNLTAGTTYYIGMAERYLGGGYQILSSSDDQADLLSSTSAGDGIYEWSAGNNPVNPSTISAGSETIYLRVTTS